MNHAELDPDFHPDDVKKHVSIDTFLNNPMGDKGQSLISKRAMDATLNVLKAQYNELVRSGKKFKVLYYKNKKDIYVKVKVPSSSFDGFYYDILFKFDSSNTTNSKLNLMPVTFFSNAASFVYTFAYTFKFFGLLIPESTKLLNPRSLKEVPVVRNPDVTVFYEKTIIMAIMHLKTSNLLDTNSAMYQSSVTNALPPKIMATIASSDSKQDEYNKLNAEKVARNKAERERKKKEKNKMRDTNKIKKDEAAFDKTINRVDTSAPKRRRRGPNKTKPDTKTSNKIDSKVDMKVDNKVKK